jgi:hypothetical protein
MSRRIIHTRQERDPQMCLAKLGLNRIQRRMFRMGSFSTDYSSCFLGVSKGARLGQPIYLILRSRVGHKTAVSKEVLWYKRADLAPAVLESNESDEAHFLRSAKTCDSQLNFHSPSNFREPRLVLGTRLVGCSQGSATSGLTSGPQGPGRRPEWKFSA